MGNLLTTFWDCSIEVLQSALLASTADPNAYWFVALGYGVHANGLPPERALTEAQNLCHFNRVEG